MHPSPPSPVHLALRSARLATLRPLVAATVAGRSRLTLEIGSGHGHYLTGFAQAHPDRLCVGIDLLLDRCERADRKRSRAALDNLHFLQADAVDFLAVLPADVTVEEVFVLFPDPWPKRRHHKNRLIQPSFLAMLASKCAAGARLCFRTDHPEYFAAAHTVVRGHPDWELRSDAAWPFELPTVFQQRADSFQSWIAVKRG